MDAVDEHELVEQAKHDPEAFGKLYQRYIKAIYNYHYRHTGDLAEAEDLTSRTFFKALENIQRYEERGASFQAWLFRIGHNLVVNWYRDRSRQPITPLDDVEEAPGIKTNLLQDELIQMEEIQQLLKLIGSLPEDRKALILLKFVQQMSNAEIAQVLGRTEEAIKALYYRTLLTLRNALLKGEFNEST